MILMRLPYPYSTITWEAGFNVNNTIPGTPALNIGEDGLMRVTPSETGLFVFAVKCDEYIDGEIIGTTTRDYQLLVIDCGVNNNPVATPFTPSGNRYNEEDTIIFAIGATDRCVDILVDDIDSDEIDARLIAIDGYEAGFLQGVPVPIVAGQGNFQVCFSECPSIQYPSGVYGMQVIIEDNTCPVPLQDTVRLFIKIESNLPAIDAGGDETICASETSTELTYSEDGVVQPVGSGTWSVLNNNFNEVEIRNNRLHFIGADSINVQQKNAYVLGVRHMIGSCIIRDYREITVNPLPDASLTQNKMTVCLADAPISLNALGITNRKAGTFTGAGITGDDIFTPSTAGLGSHPITFTYTDLATNCTNTDELFISVHPMPVPVIAAPNSICAFQNITFQNLTPVLNNIYAGEPAYTYSYEWDFGDGNTSTDENPVHSYSTSGNFTITFRIMTSVGCISEVTRPIEVRSYS